MEDLKKIQEFFSKPLDEGKQLDIEDFAKVVQAVTKTGHPVTVLLTPKFNEIEIITGMNAPDDMLFDLSNAVDNLGYGRNPDIIIAGDSSNLSRREYSDIRRVNGGHKDYFEESVNEQADHVSPMVVKAYKEYLEAKKEGNGEKAYRYYSKKLNNTYSTRADRDAIEAILKKKYGSALEESVNEGAVEIMDAFNDVMDLVKKHSRNLSDDDSYAFGLKLKAWFNKNILSEERKLTYNDFVRMVRDDMNAGSAPDEYVSDERIRKDAKYLYNRYLQGASVDDLFEATKEEENEFHKKLDKLVHKTFGPSSDEKKEMEEEISDYEEKDADYDKLYSDYLYKLVREVAAEKGYSKYLVSKDNPKGETDGLTPATLNKILMNVIKDLDETIKLGKQLNEKLCPKGEAYRKKRLAAGEKSSAYLNGRAVKVCKGQMKG